MTTVLRLNLPTPVQRLPIPGLRAELWLKQDGLAHDLYGGNKARKAAVLLEHALHVGARRVLTFGPAGSHHVFAMALFGRQLGLEVGALLFPQPATPHAKATLGLSLTAGLEAHAVSSALLTPYVFSCAYRRGDYLIPPGGSNARGALAHARAIAELEAQVDAGSLSAPDYIVVPLGSGGTAAGLLAGLARSRLKTRLLALSAVHNPLAAAQVRFLAGRCLRLQGRSATCSQWPGRLIVDASQVGAGYGIATPAGERAMTTAASVGLTLDTTYTAKAFAAALQLARGEHRIGALPGQHVLYWHTLSVAPGGTLCKQSLPVHLERLFVTR